MKILKIIWKIIIGIILIVSMMSIMAIGTTVIIDHQGPKQFWFVCLVTFFSMISLWFHFLELIGFKIWK